jgi:ribosome-associated protein
VTAKRPERDDKKKTTPAKAKSAPSARRAKPRMKATHADAPIERRPPRARKKAGDPGSADEIESRRERARASLKSLGGRVATKRLPLPQQKSQRPPSTLRPPASRRRSALPPALDRATQELAIAIAAAGLEKKAMGVEVLDVSGRVDYADYLVIMTGTSDRHVQAIANGIEEALERNNRKPLSVEGVSTASWVLMDYDDVVVHVFQEETRRLYDIEGLWMDAGRVSLDVPVEA